MKVSDYLTREDVAYFTARSDWQAWRLVLGTWLFIAVIFATVAAWPNPLTIVVAVILLAGRQLALSVLMHDCGHRTLFRSARLNDIVGQWLCALPVMNDQPSYARGHLEHHRKAGSHDDPDLANYQAYPVPWESFRRKMIRDLTGQTGFKLLSARKEVGQIVDFVKKLHDRSALERREAKRLFLAGQGFVAVQGNNQQPVGVAHRFGVQQPLPVPDGELLECAILGQVVDVGSPHVGRYFRHALEQQLGVFVDQNLAVARDDEGSTDGAAAAASCAGRDVPAFHPPGGAPGQAGSRRGGHRPGSGRSGRHGPERRGLRSRAP